MLTSSHSANTDESFEPSPSPMNKLLSNVQQLSAEEQNVLRSGVQVCRRHLLQPDPVPVPDASKQSEKPVKRASSAAAQPPAKRMRESSTTVPDAACSTVVKSVPDQFVSSTGSCQVLSGQSSYKPAPDRAGDRHGVPRHNLQSEFQPGSTPACPPPAGSRPLSAAGRVPGGRPATPALQPPPGQPGPGAVSPASGHVQSSDRRRPGSVDYPGGSSRPGWQPPPSDRPPRPAYRYQSYTGPGRAFGGQPRGASRGYVPPSRGCRLPPPSLFDLNLSPPSGFGDHSRSRSPWRFDRLGVPPRPSRGDTPSPPRRPSDRASSPSRMDRIERCLEAFLSLHRKD